MKHNEQNRISEEGILVNSKSLFVRINIERYYGCSYLPSLHRHKQITHFGKNINHEKK